MPMLNWFESRIDAAPTPPLPGPHRRAVLLHEGGWRLFEGVLEACEYAHANGLIGAHVRCIGATEPCATIEAFDVADLYALNRVYPIGRLSAHIGYAAETVLERIAI